LARERVGGRGDVFAAAETCWWQRRRVDGRGDVLAARERVGGRGGEMHWRQGRWAGGKGALISNTSA
jgi:hypothetical protein